MKESLLDKLDKLHIFSGTSHPTLTRKIADYIGHTVGEIHLNRFNDGEINVLLGENVRGKDVFLVQTLSNPVHDMIMELLLIVDALKRSSVKTVTVLIPYYAYNRQDVKIYDRDPIAAKLLANLISSVGVDSVVTMDLHSGQTEGFFDIPVENISANSLLAEYIHNLLGDNNDDIIVVSPDMGGVNRTRTIAKVLNCPIAILDKRRPKPDIAVVVDIVGEVRGKKAILFDDIIDTAGSILQGAIALEQAGASEIYACCTHAVFSGDALEQIEKSIIKKVIVTNTLPVKTQYSSKIDIVDVTSLFAEVVLRIYNKESIRKLSIY